MSPSAVSLTNKDNIYRIRMSGEADIDFVNTFSRIASELEQKKEPSVLVVDMKDITYIDSSSLTVFVRLIKLYQKKNNSIILFKPRHAIRELFNLTGLSRMVAVCDGKDDLDAEIARRVSKKAPAKS